MAKATIKPKAAPKKKPVKDIEKSPTNKSKLKLSIEPPPKKCSFCGKPSIYARRFIAGPNNIFICDECIDVCVRILIQDEPLEWRKSLLKILTINEKTKKTSSKKANLSKPNKMDSK